MIIRDDIPVGWTCDDNGRLLTRKDSDGWWCEYTRDSCGRQLSYRNAREGWCEYFYDLGVKVTNMKVTKI